MGHSYKYRSVLNHAYCRKKDRYNLKVVAPPSAKNSGKRPIRCLQPIYDPKHIREFMEAHALAARFIVDPVFLTGDDDPNYSHFAALPREPSFGGKPGKIIYEKISPGYENYYADLKEAEKMPAEPGSFLYIFSSHAQKMFYFDKVQRGKYFQKDHPLYFVSDGCKVNFQLGMGPEGITLLDHTPFSHRSQKKLDRMYDWLKNHTEFIFIGSEEKVKNAIGWAQNLLVEMGYTVGTAHASATAPLNITVELLGQGQEEKTKSTQKIIYTFDGLIYTRPPEDLHASKAHRHFH